MVSYIRYFCHVEVPNVRLVDGTKQNMGKVEIYYKGQWGALCSDEWDINEAMVVCKSLGYAKAKKVKMYTLFGEKMWIDSVNCNGYETSLLSCGSFYDGRFHCSSGKAAGVICGKEHCC